MNKTKNRGLARKILKSMAAKESTIQKALLAQKLKQNIVRKNGLKREWTFDDITDYLNSISPNKPKISMEQVRNLYNSLCTQDYQKNKVCNKIVDQMFCVGIKRVSDFLEKTKISHRKKTCSDHTRFEKIINDEANTEDEERMEQCTFRKIHSLKEGGIGPDSIQSSKLELGSREDITTVGTSEKKESTSPNKIFTSEIHPTVLEEKMAVTDSSCKQDDIDTQEDLVDFLNCKEIQG
ncbi:unnamed protein product [Moneuplotes crassus]|uniref:Uncharacterized protein n=1 Tax=Euplotes crassus TaxID=5936 RepID=A0AAD1YAP6_EUPCR|nr:unnamed protein product [Moneuplotes crassus]